jgi:hypothetical protein
LPVEETFSAPGYARFLDPAGKFLSAGGAAEISRWWSEAEPPVRLYPGTEKTGQLFFMEEHTHWR